MKLWQLCTALFLDGLLCASFSKSVRAKTLTSWCFAITTVFSAFIWAGMARNGSKSLAYMSILYDVLYAGGYFAFLLFTGERLTWLSALGVVLALTGVSLMSLQG